MQKASTYHQSQTAAAMLSSREEEGSSSAPTASTAEQRHHISSGDGRGGDANDPITAGAGHLYSRMPYAAATTTAGSGRAVASRLRDVHSNQQQRGGQVEGDNDAATTTMVGAVDQLRHLGDTGVFEEGLSNGSGSDGNNSNGGDEEQQYDDNGNEEQQQQYSMREVPDEDGADDQGFAAATVAEQQRQVMALQQQQVDQQRLLIMQQQQQRLMMLRQRQEQQILADRGGGGGPSAATTLQQMMGGTRVAVSQGKQENTSGFDGAQQFSTGGINSGINGRKGSSHTLTYQHHQDTTGGIQQQQGGGGQHQHGGLGTSIDPSATPESARARQAEGSWQCEQCGNINYANRLFCNMHKCQAPRPLSEWRCVCGNLNYRNRFVCNMRKCGLPRPMDSQTQALLFNRRAMELAQQQQQQQGQQQVGEQSMMELAYNESQQQRAAAAASLLMRGSPVAAGAGATAQYNILPPSFTIPAAAAGQQLQGGGGGVGNMAQGGEGIQQQQQQAVPGSWVCSACNNVNYPHRLFCNGHHCKRPRYEVDPTYAHQLMAGNIPTTLSYTGGNILLPAAPQLGQQQQAQHLTAATQLSGGQDILLQQQHNRASPSLSLSQQQQQVERGRSGMGAPIPEGCWTCLECGNLNYPRRTFCNKRGCGAPRPEGRGE